MLKLELHSILTANPIFNLLGVLLGKKLFVYKMFNQHIVTELLISREVANESEIHKKVSNSHIGFFVFHSLSS